MERVILAGLLCLLLSSGLAAGETHVRAMSFNIRYDEPADGANEWENRKDFVVQLLRDQAPDIVGLQEALKGQLDYLDEQLPEYRWIGVGRDDGRQAGEYTAIFYRHKRFEPVSDSTIWCSQTPQKPGLGWDAVCNRTITFGLFREVESGTLFSTFNTHFDHRGILARAESARLLIETVNKNASDVPVIVTGDFNVTPDSEPYQILTAMQPEGDARLFDSRTISLQTPGGPAGTFTGFDIAAEPAQPIDYIFIGRDIRVVNHLTIDQTFSGRLPSDHYPVMADLIL